jgi:type I restriction enzyme, S subunit
MMLKLRDILDGCLFTDGDWIESKDQDPEGEIRLIQLADIGDGKFINKSSRYMNQETATALKCTYLKTGDVLIARMPDPLGRACIFPLAGEKKYVTAVDVCIIRNGENIDRKYLKYAINSPFIRHDISRQSTGTTRKRITRKKLGELQIPLPSLTEQKQIAAILDAADELRQKDKALIAKYDELTQSLFLDMFGDPVTNPKGWETKSIEQLIIQQKGALKRGPFGGALKKEIFVNEGYLVYEQYHALNNDFTMARYFIDENKFKELQGFEVKPGDIIISCSGVNLGRLAIVPKEAKKGIINQALLKLTLDNEIMSNILFTYIFTDVNFKGKFFGFQRGSGVPNFPPMSTFKRFKFICPPRKVQKQFAERIQAMEAQKMLASESLIKSEDLFNSLLQKAFKGELTR